MTDSTSSQLEIANLKLALNQPQKINNSIEMEYHYARPKEC